jgi:hypothetical protein
LIACFVALVLCVTAQANLIGVNRDTDINASATAGAILDNKSTTETTFANFDKTFNAGAAASGATGSATTSQVSSVSNGSGPISARGGAASAFSGSGAASAGSSFQYQFVSDTTDLYRFLGGISASGSGNVAAYLHDTSAPPDVNLLFREVGSGLTPTDSWIQDFMLQAGHTYDIFVGATSGPAQGSTSYNIQLNPVPEPGLGAIMIGLGLYVLKRRR